MSNLTAKQIRHLVTQLNQLANPKEHILSVAIQAGGILTELKEAVGHGKWRLWVRDNLHYSLRTAQVYMKIWENRAKLTNAKNVQDALDEIQRLVKHKEKPKDAIGADYHKIRSKIIRPIRLARRQFERLTYVGDSAEMMDEIRREIQNELEEFLFLFNE